MSATGHGLPLLCTLLLWFSSTGLIVWLDNRPVATFRRSLSAAGLLAIVSIVAIAATANDDGIAASYISFAAALCIWGWHEMSFLMGAISGPRKAPCPPDAHGWRRFRLAAATLMHHEIALAATALLIVALTWGQPNFTAPAAFGLLFAMRLSTKLNIFLGVPNFGDELLPGHLAYLKGYFRGRPFNPLFPVSLGLAITVCAWLGRAALDADSGEAAGLTLLFGLAALGVLEHLFLVLPLPDQALWRWAAPAKSAKTKAATAAATE